VDLAEDLGRSWTWVLPADPTCARAARRYLRQALDDLGVSKDTAADAELMASELATNAHQHASDASPHELWLYCVDEFEFCCAVFDGKPAREKELDVDRGDYGRGLSIVAELSKGRWGTSAARGRLDPRLHGKAVWFLCRR
jgi:hypothetical protein